MAFPIDCSQLSQPPAHLLTWLKQSDAQFRKEMRALLKTLEVFSRVVGSARFVHTWQSQSERVRFPLLPMLGRVFPLSHVNGARILYPGSVALCGH